MNSAMQHITQLHRRKDTDTPEDRIRTKWIAVIAGGALLVLGTLSVLVYLHFRRRRKDRQEEARDQFDRDDYGLDPIEHVEPSGPAKYHNIQRPPSSHSNINAPQRHGGQGKDPFSDSIDRPERSDKMI